MTSTHLSDANCIFCKIIAGDIPAIKIYEDDETLAFLDVNPIAEGHTLVVPKDHFENVHTVPAEQWCRVMLAVQKVATAVLNGVNADGVNIVMNNESAAGQEVMHAHVHIIPRHNDDGFEQWKGKAYKSAEESAAIADKVKTELK
jgi:histidine triad (HIT) family protein